MKEQEERGKGRENSVACRLEIIGVRISGQSVIFIVDAVVWRIVDSISLHTVTSIIAPHTFI